MDRETAKLYEIDIIKEVKQKIGFKDMNMRIGIHTVFYNLFTIFLSII